MQQQKLGSHRSRKTLLKLGSAYALRDAAEKVGPGRTDRRSGSGSNRDGTVSNRQLNERSSAAQKRFEARNGSLELANPSDDDDLPTVEELAKRTAAAEAAAKAARKAKIQMELQTHREQLRERGGEGMTARRPRRQWRRPGAATTGSEVPPSEQPAESSLAGGMAVPLLGMRWMKRTLLGGISRSLGSVKEVKLPPPRARLPELAQQRRHSPLYACALFSLAVTCVPAVPAVRDDTGEAAAAALPGAA